MSLRFFSVIIIYLVTECKSQDIIDRASCVTRCGQTSQLTKQIDDVESEQNRILLDVQILEDRMAELQEMNHDLAEKNADLEQQLKYLRNIVSNLVMSTSGGSIFRDCGDIESDKSGIYRIKPHGSTEEFSVYCEVRADGSKWTVFQRRQDGSVNFYRGWQEYEAGFGGFSSEFWLGNRLIHQITSQGDYELRVDLADFNTETRYALYKTFRVGDENTNYRLTISGYSGNAGDAMSDSDGLAFSTYDRDNDNAQTEGYNSAEDLSGAWWYGYQANLNGIYYDGGPFSGDDGMFWEPWKGYYYSMKYTNMAVKRRP